MCISITACSNEKTKDIIETTNEPTTKSEYEKELESFKESVAEYVEKQKELDKQLEEALKNENQELIESEPNEIVNEYDYSNIGFENTEGFDTWIMIKGYSFSDDSPYVYVSSRSDYPTLHFNNGFLKKVHWNRDDIDNKIYEFDEDGVGGYVYNTVNYGVVDNNTISFTSGYYNGSTFLIKDRIILNGIPFLDCDFLSTSRHQVYDNGVYIPVGFLDWSKQPEIGTHINDNGIEIDVIKYYIDNHFIRG